MTNTIEIYNPDNRPEDELPIIFGYISGGRRGHYEGILISDFGWTLYSTVSASEGFVPYDLGIYKGSRPALHDRIKRHFPSGYRMEYIGRSDVKTHEGLSRALMKMATFEMGSKFLNRITK